MEHLYGFFHMVFPFIQTREPVDVPLGGIEERDRNTHGPVDLPPTISKEGIFWLPCREDVTRHILVGYVGCGFPRNQESKDIGG